jgi:hypothetical protein
LVKRRLFNETNPILVGWGDVLGPRARVAKSPILWRRLGEGRHFDKTNPILWDGETSLGPHARGWRKSPVFVATFGEGRFFDKTNPIYLGCGSIYKFSKNDLPPGHSTDVQMLAARGG